MISDTLRVAIGITLAVCAAAGFGLCSVLQYQATHQVPEERAGRPRLLLDLLRRREWRWSIVLTVIAFAMQVAALRLIPLIFVQPLLVTGLLWYVLLSAALHRQRPDGVLIAAALLCLAGISAFLVLAQPIPGGTNQLDRAWTVVPLAAGLGASIAGCLIVATAVGRRWRSLPLALAAGICYGATAGLIRSLSPYFTDGLPVVLGHWQTYAIAVLGPLGLLFSQNALQAGKLGSPALATITITDPLVAIGIGLLWLGESIRHDPLHLLGELGALAALAGAVFLLAGRAPRVRAGTG